MYGQTKDNDQVPIFCLANAIDVIKPLLIKYADDNLSAPKPKPAPPVEPSNLRAESPLHRIHGQRKK